MRLIELAIARARTVVLVLLLLLLSGTVTYLDIAREADPDVTIPVLITRVILDGVSPEDADRMLVRPLERALESIDGGRKLRAFAFEGGAQVALEFDAGFDADTALADVRDAIERVRADLPDEAMDPTIEEITLAAMPQLVVGLGGDVPERALYRVADELESAIEALPGVLDVVINGKREEMVEVLVDPLALESHGIAQLDLAGAVARNNALVAAGVLDSGAGRIALKVPGVIRHYDELNRLPLKAVDGQVVTLGDVAAIRRVFQDATAHARVNGQPSVTMEIQKRNGANVVATVAAVRALIDAQRQAWPEVLSVSYFGDRSIEIVDMLGDLQNSVLLAVLLVIVVTVATLGLRSALLVAVAIPGSFVMGMLVIGLLGMTVNIVVLFSLIMAVGIVVDGAIVVTEYADRRLLDGLSPRAAYLESASRMAMPIAASTATTLAAFLPLLFWPGVVGEFMRYLPVTLIATLSASLLMALLFVPTLGALLGRSAPGAGSANIDTARLDTNGVDTGSSIGASPAIVGAYGCLLHGAVRAPGTVVLAVIALLLAVGVVYQRHGHGTEFFPDVEPQQAVVTLLAHAELSVRERDALLREVEAPILELPEIRMAYATTLLDGNDRVAMITLEFVDWDQRDRRVDAVLAEIRGLQSRVPGLKLEIQKINAGPGGDRKPLQVAFVSSDPGDAAMAVQRFEDWMQRHGGFTDIENSLPSGGLEWHVQVDRALAGQFGADIRLVGDFVQLVSNGVELSRYRPDDASEELEIRLRFPPEFRRLTQLHALRVPTIDGYVPLSNFASVTPGAKVSVIERLDGQPVYHLKAAPAPLPGEDYVNTGQLVNARLAALHEAAATLVLPDGVEVIFEGQDEDQQESSSFLVKALIVALFLMAIIMVAQLNSFYQAFLVLSAVLFSLGGVFLGLLVNGEAFGVIMSGVGVIALAGIVVNNNIVLIDTYNGLRRDGLSACDAAVLSGTLRLRPVMLTTITTILGLLPMVLRVNVDIASRSISVGSPSMQWWSQLATAVAGGLAFATVLTLVVTPCLLAAPTVIRARRRVARLQRELAARRAGA